MLLARIAARIFNFTAAQGASAIPPADFLLPRDLWGASPPPHGSGLTDEELQMIGQIDPARTNYLT